MYSTFVRRHIIQLQVIKSTVGLTVIKNSLEFTYYNKNTDLKFKKKFNNVYIQDRLTIHLRYSIVANEIKLL